MGRWRRDAWAESLRRLRLARRLPSIKAAATRTVRRSATTGRCWSLGDFCAVRGSLRQPVANPRAIKQGPAVAPGRRNPARRGFRPEAECDLSSPRGAPGRALLAHGRCSMLEPSGSPWWHMVRGRARERVGPALAPATDQDLRERRGRSDGRGVSGRSAHRFHRAARGGEGRASCRAPAINMVTLIGERPTTPVADSGRTSPL